MKEKEYRSAEGFNQSLLKQIVDYDFNAGLGIKAYEDFKPTKPTMLGNAGHEIILEEPENVYVKEDGYRFKNGEEQKLKDEGKYIITKENETFLYKVKEDFKKHPNINFLMTGAKFEQCKFKTIEIGGHKVKIKGKADIVNNYIADLKFWSFQGAISKDTVNYQALKRGVSLQASFYLDLFDLPEFYLIVIDTKFGSITPFKVPDDWIEKGRAEYNQALMALIDYNNNPSEILTLSENIIEFNPMPDWASEFKTEEHYEEFDLSLPF